jgi:hypothetical protein
VVGAVIAALVAAAILGTVGLMRSTDDEQDRGVSGDAPETPSASAPAPAPSSTTAAIGPSPTEIVEQVSPPSTTLLGSLEPINVGLDVDTEQNVQLGGVPYLHSVWHNCFAFCNDQVGTIEYNLGGNYRQFTATIGVTDDAGEIEQVGAFTVLLDGSPAGSWVAKFGEPQEISVDVAGALRLELQSGRPGTVAGSPADAAMAGANAAVGVSNGLPSLAWGSPLLTS